MFIHEHQLRVRYGETDQMGYVYYGHYALYYEVARVEALRSLGTSYRQLEDAGIMLPVAEVQSKYLKAATYDALLTIKTMVKTLPSAQIVFDYEIYQDEQLIHTAMVKLVFVDKQSRKITRCPTSLLEAMKRFY